MQILSPEAAIRRLPARGRIFVSPECGIPTSLCDALGDEYAAFDALEIFAALMFQPVGFLAHVPEPFRFTTSHVSSAVASLVDDGRADFLPIRYSQLSNVFAQSGPLPVDAVLVQVSPPDEHGYCTLGASVSACLDLIPQTPLVIAEINARAPRTHGNRVHVSDIDFACEVDRSLVPYEPARVGEVEHAIAVHVAELVPDGACFQIGIGSIPQAILEALGDHRDLGIHSGMVCDGMIPLIERGVVTGRRKNVDTGLVVAGVALGTETLFRYIDDNPTFAFVAGAHSHGLRVVSSIDNFVAINSAVQVDLSGQVNAEWIAGHQISGIGGQFDFVEAAMHANGGRSIIALPSTAAHGTVSRIVRTLDTGAMVTTPRYCIDFVVTEYGIADLRGKSLRQRAQALAKIAHPGFRDELTTAPDAKPV